MSVELRPLGVKCNLACTYCYQSPQREAGNLPEGKNYDIARMKTAVESEGGPFTLFGGEPLLIPVTDLQEILAWGYDRWGSNRIQTNGTIITNTHIDLFRRYNVHVGISLDGPGELNDARRIGNLRRTRRATQAIERAIERLIEAEVPVSLIITIHRGNASVDRLPILLKWMRHVHRLGVHSMRVHLLESESDAIRSEWGLSPTENIHALRSIGALERDEPRLRIDVFEDMRRMLVGNDEGVTCIWRACDAYTTRAVRGVEGHGQRSNCGRTNKDGIDFVKASIEGFERYIALYHTPQEYGGCSGCRFFLMCKGQCPGTAIDGDWRNRTEHCEVWFDLLEQLEFELAVKGKIPLSLQPRRSDVENALIAAWTAGRNPSLASILRNLGIRGVTDWTDEVKRLVRELELSLSGAERRAD